MMELNNDDLKALATFESLTGASASDVVITEHAVVFLVAGGLSLRIFFGRVLERLVTRVPAGHHLRGLLLFPKIRAEALASTPGE